MTYLLKKYIFLKKITLSKRINITNIKYYLSNSSKYTQNLCFFTLRSYRKEISKLNLSRIKKCDLSIGFINIVFNNDIIHLRFARKQRKKNNQLKFHKLSLAKNSCH